MEPRNFSLRGQRSTSIPSETLETIKAGFEEDFESFLEGRPVYVEGRIYTSEVLVSVGFKPELDGLRQVNIEASMDHSTANVTQIIETCANALNSVFQDYVEAKGLIDLPVFWKEFPFGVHKVFIQTSGRNTSLESEADRILGLEPGDALFIEAEGDDFLGDNEDLEELLH